MWTALAMENNLHEWPRFCCVCSCSFAGKNLPVAAGRCPCEWGLTDLFLMELLLTKYLWLCIICDPKLGSALPSQPFFAYCRARKVTLSPSQIKKQSNIYSAPGNFFGNLQRMFQCCKIKCLTCQCVFHGKKNQSTPIPKPTPLQSFSVLPQNLSFMPFPVPVACYM